MAAPLLIIHVHVQVKPEYVDAFLAATLENARASLQESGIARFDLVQANDDPTHFVLVEAYKTEAAPDAHRRTAHYVMWRDRVAEMMAAPRSSTRFHNCFPENQGW
jgi:autoinducer 2-degrading protein